MQLLLPIVIPMSPTLDTRDSTLARIFAVDQHGYVNASELARWMNDYRKAFGMGRKDMKYAAMFKKRTGKRTCAKALGWELGPKGEVFAGPQRTSKSGELAPMDQVEQDPTAIAFRTGQTKSVDTWIHEALLSRYLQYLGSDLGMGLDMHWAGRWKAHRNLVFTLDNKVLPTADDTLRTRLTQADSAICEKFDQWQEINPGVSSVQGGRFYQVYKDYVIRALFGKGAGQLKRHYKLSTSIYNAFPALMLEPLVQAFEEAISLVSPTMEKEDLQGLLKVCGTRYLLSEEKRQSLRLAVAA